MEGFIHSTESFGTVDGPGIRFVIFFQGCPMRCLYCHNPDTWKIGTGTKRTVESLLAEYDSVKEFMKNGGITCTGGEPLVQIDFVTELFEKAKEKGIHTCLDSSGITFTPDSTEKFERLCKCTDLVMLDIKHIDDEQHKILTGQTNKNILDMAEYLSETGKPVWIRHVLVPERSDKDEYLHRLHDFIETLDNVEKVEVLPYHTLGVYKWKELGIPYQLEGIDPPSQERVENANRILETAKYHA